MRRDQRNRALVGVTGHLQKLRDQHQLSHRELHQNHHGEAAEEAQSGHVRECLEVLQSCCAFSSLSRPRATSPA